MSPESEEQLGISNAQGGNFTPAEQKVATFFKKGIRELNKWQFKQCQRFQLILSI